VKNTDITNVFLHYKTWKTRVKSDRLHKRTGYVHIRDEQTVFFFRLRRIQSNPTKFVKLESKVR